MLYLDYTPTNLRVKSHWITFCIFSPLAAAFLLGWFVSISVMILWPVLLAIIVVIGWVFKSVPAYLYSFVRRLLKKICKIGGSFILFVMYYGFLTPLGLFGSKEKMHKTGERTSGWQKYSGKRGYKLGSSDNFLAWVFGSGKWWMLFLYPYIILLRIYRMDINKRSIPTDTYTLY